MSSLNILSLETARPVPYLFCEPDSGSKLDLSLTCKGELQWQVQDEKLFKDCCPSGDADIAAFEDRLRTDVLAELMPALSVLSSRGVSYKALAGESEELSREVLSRLAPYWEARGIKLESFRLTEAQPAQKDLEIIAMLKKQAEYRDPQKMAEALLKAQQEALKAGAWKCPYCDSFNLGGNFCPHCGAKKPE